MRILYLKEKEFLNQFAKCFFVFKLGKKTFGWNGCGFVIKTDRTKGKRDLFKRLTKYQIKSVMASIPLCSKEKNWTSLMLMFLQTLKAKENEKDKL